MIVGCDSCKSLSARVSDRSCQKTYTDIYGILESGVARRGSCTRGAHFGFIQSFRRPEVFDHYRDMPKEREVPIKVEEERGPCQSARCPVALDFPYEGDAVFMQKNCCGKSRVSKQKHHAVLEDDVEDWRRTESYNSDVVIDIPNHQNHSVSMSTTHRLH